MATEEDRSLGAAMPLPMWMRGRGRLHDKLDFDQSAFSPPENDDSFLYIRYPKVKEEANIAGDKGAQSQLSTIDGKLKSSGANDGFDKDNCGSSVIKVASQMVAGKVVKGFDTFDDEEKEHMKTIGFDPKLRRGSRSLPASPLQSPNSSPKSKRKLAGNKYFTSAYADDKKPGSILANLLALRDSTLSQSVTSIAEETTPQLEASISKLTASGASKKVPPVPKPSHLREMNFWSPTSM